MIWARLGAAFMLAAVAAGAFGAHALKSRLAPEMLQVFEVGVRYWVYHALGLFIVAWLSTIDSSPALRRAGGSFVAGILVFAGSLCGYAVTGWTPLVMAAPVGGLLFMVGWFWVFRAAQRR